MTALATKHGMSLEDLIQMRDEQQGLCYLCADPLPGDRVFVAIDHDHRCCPAKRSCAHCRRGLTCHSCNVLIGHANDDPQRLRRIADNLEAAIAAVTQRIADKPAQAEPRELAKRRSAPRPRGVLADACRVFGDDTQLQWIALAGRLAEHIPSRWAGTSAEAVSAQCRALGVPSVDVRFPAGRGGQNRKGCRKADIWKAAARGKDSLAA